LSPSNYTVNWICIIITSSFFELDGPSLPVRDDPASDV
jgi:hypothetical protein